MEYTLKSLDNFRITGISVRTTNQDSQSDKDIGSLWQRFTEGNLAAQIADKASDDIYCVYTEYESDHTGPYTAILGLRVNSGGSEAPRGFVNVDIPAGNYRVYKLEGKFPESIANTWRQIWKDPIERKYTADFDLYKAGAKSFEETEAVIYLAV
jgi:predicted transcriptional regulator YdeE